jgi:hypothetical protein
MLARGSIRSANGMQTATKMGCEVAARLGSSYTSRKARKGTNHTAILS